MWNPRTCGEKSLTCERIDFRLGSPPRRRGKVQLVECILARAGITPAWAGKSFCRHSHVIQNADHPRVGGEKSWNLRLFSVGAGSPPRGRGKAALLLLPSAPCGITPAWAGKRRAGKSRNQQSQDHPRVGGEKGIVTQGVSAMWGSPPRGRGKAVQEYQDWQRSRITPAWAGKRFIAFLLLDVVGDHPRVGGEKFLHVIWLCLREGSPPRGRGKVQGSAAQGCPQGDHPRVGGEKISLAAMLPPPPGSPPRGRGKVLKIYIVDGTPGITPAWAGKRLKRSHRSGIFISGPIPFHSVLHRPAGSGGSRAGRDGSPAGQPQNTGPA